MQLFIPSGGVPRGQTEAITCLRMVFGPYGKPVNRLERNTPMAYYFDEPSHTFAEYLLVPSYSSAECTPQNTSLATPHLQVPHRRAEPAQHEHPAGFRGHAVRLRRKARRGARAEGGISFIFVSQPIDSQCEMIRSVKSRNPVLCAAIPTFCRRIPWGMLWRSRRAPGTPPSPLRKTARRTASSSAL